MPPNSTAPNSTPPPNADRIRVRNNQRRARARQKEYIQNLETRLQHYERKGVEATIEVQNAARAVAEENARLREENRRLHGELLELRNLMEGAPATSEQVIQDQAKDLEIQEPSAPVQESEIDKRCGSNESAATGSGCMTSSMTLEEDTSSCEYAAHIITSMRADVSTDDLRAELGCADTQEWKSCKVDNGRLFLAVDRYAG
ncbi:MAG: hypothetical protein Q9217_006062 [Psora testacea]